MAATDPFGVAVYGAAAPLCLVCLAVARWAIKDRDRQVAEAKAETAAERTRTEAMTAQMIELQGRVAPLLSEAAVVIRALDHRREG